MKKPTKRFDEVYADFAHKTTQDVVLSEKGKKYIGRNLKPVDYFHVDGDIVPKNDPRMRCDFSIFTEETSNLYLIELKGGNNLAHAAKQISMAIEILLTDEVMKPNNTYARIVLSKSPGSQLPLSVEEKILRQKLHRLNGSFKEGHIQKQSKRLEEKLI
ncbi:MAG: hypothetical protein LBL81_05845 [Tannerella sp.]|jgi:hypothetical protein|nr:hypothetical protein [Tannerella sp.]